MMDVRLQRSGGTTVGVVELSVMDLSEVLDLPSHPANRDRSANVDRHDTRHSSTEASRYFGGLRSNDEARRLVANGWPEGARRLRELAGRSARDVPAAVSRRRRPTWGDDGDTLDVDRAMAGQWDSAYRTTRRQLTTGASILELVGGWGGTTRYSAEELFWSGAAMLVATDLLEDAGYSVRLVGMNVSSQDDNAYTVSRVILKDAGEPMRMDALAAVMCHGGIFRSMGLKTKTFVPFGINEGFGTTQSLIGSEDILRRVGEWPAEAIVLDNAYSREAAIRNISKVLQHLQGSTGEAA